MILQVLPELLTGGVERSTVDTSRELVKKNFKSVVISSGGPLAAIIGNQGGILYTLPLKSKNPISIYKNIAKIRKIIRKEKVDLVHAHSRAPAWSAYFAAKQENIPFVTTFHGFYKFSNSLKKWYNSVMTKGFMVVAVSEFIKDHILENYNVPVDHLRVIHQGIDFDQFNPEKISFQRMNQVIQKYNLPDDKIILCLPGRITGWKGHDVLIKAISTLPKEKYHCIFAGNYKKKPGYYASLVDLINKLGLTEHFTFTGDSQDVQTIYKLSDIIISTSKEPEAFGRVVVEGQAMCKIVIASDIGGSKETIKNGKTGFLFESNNAADLAAKINAATKLTPKQIAAMGKAAREHVKANFSLKKMLDKTLKLYQQVIANFKS